MAAVALIAVVAVRLTRFAIGAIGIAPALRLPVVMSEACRFHVVVVRVNPVVAGAAGHDRWFIVAPTFRVSRWSKTSNQQYGKSDRNLAAGSSSENHPLSPYLKIVVAITGGKRQSSPTRHSTESAGTIGIRGISGRPGMIRTI
jgi:hypothetical protein